MCSGDLPANTQSKTSETKSLAESLHLDGESFIESAYLTLLRRVPDSSGRAFYLNQLKNGVAKIQILVEIGLSDEAHQLGVLNYQELLSLDGEQFIECAYYRLLKRLPDSSEGKFYLDQLLRGVAKIQILDELSSSDEGKHNGVRLPELQDGLAKFKRASQAV